MNIFYEYVPGGSIASLLKNYGAFEESLACNFVRQILRGLAYLHEQNIIHRDIRGTKILINNQGGVKISGFHRSMKADDTSRPGEATTIQQSSFWMAPEVINQTAHTTKSDIWSLGCLVIEMITAKHPWPQLTEQQAIAQVNALCLFWLHTFTYCAPRLVI